MIQIVGPQLYQWDTGRFVSANDTNSTHVHFANQGDSKAPIIELVDGQAKIPDYLLQTGKALCVYLVLDGVTQESKTFHVTKRERPENYVYEEDQRNFIYELITDAQTATETANQVAQDLREAKEQGEFNGPKGDPFLIVNDASGHMISVDDAANSAFLSMHIFGKTTQDGTPTPDAPVELVSVGDSGGITVNVTGKNDAQSMTIATPNGLPGVSVSSGGNYTDANGQQWICDEIDLARGVFVRRVGQKLFSGDMKENWKVYPSNEHGGFYRIEQDMAVGSRQGGYCNRYQVHRIANTKVGMWLGVSDNSMYVHNASTIATDLSSWLSWLSNNPTMVQYVLATPIETPLSEEELAAYAALHTYRGHTTISNDASAHMEIEYVMDAKKYIDSLVISGGGSILPATVE